MPDLGDVDFIVVTYNSLHHIDACLKSILGAGFDESQVYVMDSNSADETVTYTSHHYPRVNLIQSSKNLGFTRANNIAFGKSFSRTVIFANPDVIFLPGAIEELLKELYADESNGICGPLIVDQKMRPKPESYLPSASVLGTLLLQSHLWKPVYHLRRFLDQLGRTPSRPRRRAALSGACMVMRRKDFEKVGGFNEGLFMYAEDVDLCEKVSCVGLKIVQVPKAKMVHLGGGTYIGSRDVFFHSLKSMDTVFLKSRSTGTLLTKRLTVLAGLSLRWAYFSAFQRLGLSVNKELPARLWEGITPFISRRLLVREPLRFPQS